MTSRIGLVHGATAASNAQPSQSPNRASTARTTPVTDTAADTPRPRGVGGYPTSSVDWLRLGAIVAVAVFIGGFWSAIALLLAGLTLGVFLFAIPLAMIGGIWLAERWWPNADLLGHAAAGDELRVRTELYRPGRLLEASPLNHRSESDWERQVQERYEHSWDEPEF